MYDLFFIQDDRDPVSAWQEFKERFPHAKLVGKSQASFEYLSRMSMTRRFWTVESDLLIDDGWQFDYIIKSWDNEYVHIYPSYNYHGATRNDFSGHSSIKLWPSTMENKDIDIYGDFSDIKIKIMEDIICFIKPYDIFFIDYEKTEDSWNRFFLLYPTAIRVNFSKNHAEFCNKNASSRMFYVIDSDVICDDDWDFGFTASSWDQECVHTWDVRLSLGTREKIIENGFHLALWPKGVPTLDVTEQTKIKKMPDIVASISPPDIFYVSDGVSDSFYQEFSSRFPNSHHVVGKQHFLNNCISRSKSSLFYVVDSDVELDDGHNLDYYPPRWDKKFIHIWPSANKANEKKYLNPTSYGSVMLWSKISAIKKFDSMITPFSDIKNLKIMNETISHLREYDIFFITYEEPNAQENWEKLSSRFPRARRLHGIKGIHLAHLECARQSNTEMFWTVDGDTIVDDDWDFSYHPPKWDKEYLHLWQSRNPVNGLVYGYGSIKLWPKNRLLAHKGNWLDFTTTVGKIKMMDMVISTTSFNSSEYETWKSAFRECTKLQFNLQRNAADIESQIRLDCWLRVENHDAPNSSWAIKGAKDSLEWFNKNQYELYKINDFSWLKSYYETLYR